jgi:hypothetical protein
MRGDDLTRILDLHTTWLFESEFSLHHRGRVIEVEGSLDSFDSDVLCRALARMTGRLPQGSEVTLDLRHVKGITKGACDALVDGTVGLRSGGGAVRMVVPSGAPPWLVVLQNSAAAQGIEVVHPDGRSRR